MYRNFGHYIRIWKICTVAFRKERKVKGILRRIDSLYYGYFNLIRKVLISKNLKFGLVCCRQDNAIKQRCFVKQTLQTTEFI